MYNRKLTPPPTSPVLPHILLSSNLVTTIRSCLLRTLSSSSLSHQDQPNQRSQSAVVSRSRLPPHPTIQDNYHHRHHRYTYGIIALVPPANTKQARLAIGKKKEPSNAPRRRKTAS